MNEKYLVINAGSSSLKFSLYELPLEKEIVNGYVEKIGLDHGFYTLKFEGKKVKKEESIQTHGDAIRYMIDELLENQFINKIEDIKGIGHRILHGGELYSDSILINKDVLNDIKILTKLGPLHHPVELEVIESLIEILPNVPQIAVFDTAFHQTMPQENYMYPVPYEWYEKYGVRKYGFHGISYKYITEAMINKLKNKTVNLIICHIGNGASICCVKEGMCYDTTMGITPLDGLMMGTRCGAIDPSILEYVCKESGMSIEEVTSALNKKSGLLGISGNSDCRDVEKAAINGDEKSLLALKMDCNRVAKYIAEYFIELEGMVDAIVFTAGVGENGILFRKEVLKRLSPLGIVVDNEKNESISAYKEAHEGLISSKDSSINVYVMPTNEEIMILRDTVIISQNVKNN